jgi:hypothetical protein
MSGLLLKIFEISVEKWFKKKLKRISNLGALEHYLGICHRFYVNFIHKSALIP